MLLPEKMTEWKRGWWEKKKFFLANKILAKTKTLSFLFVGKKSFVLRTPILLPHHFFTCPPPPPASHPQSFFFSFLWCVCFSKNSARSPLNFAFLSIRNASAARVGSCSPRPFFLEELENSPAFWSHHPMWWCHLCVPRPGGSIPLVLCLHASSWCVLAPLPLFFW